MPRNIFRPTAIVKLSLCELIDVSSRRLIFLVKSGAPDIVVKLERTLLRRRIAKLGEPDKDSLHPEGI